MKKGGGQYAKPKGGFFASAEDARLKHAGEVSGGIVLPANPFIEFRKDEIEQSITSRFEQQVMKNPDRLAVGTGRTQLSYSDLNRTANRIAWEILKRCNKVVGLVAFLMELDAPLLAAILGVLKTGMAYVPLDPSFANTRNAGILEDSGAGLLITDSKNEQTAEALKRGALRVVNIDVIGPLCSDENPGLSVSPDTTAYILYTSGSTGKPKGVFQSHRNVLHNIRNYTNGLHISAEDRLTLLYSCSFGASVSDIFGALLNGAVLFPFDLKKEGLARLADWLVKEDITIYHSVPTVYRHFIAALSGIERFPRLRIIKLGGEPVQVRDLELYKKHFHEGCIFHVGLGSTEMGIIRQLFCDHRTSFSGGVLPVGYPVEGTEVLLLDDRGEKVALGLRGEISIRSRYLAEGYWQNPDLTKSAFLPDPAGGAERIYRTGDIGCMLPDTCLTYLGRKDFQLKIRGYRVEAAEVETALMEIAAIKEAVVAGHEDRYGDKQLVAYIAADRQSVHPYEIRRLLRQRLPDYMVPTSFVMMDALPMTPNGKIDRMALPPPSDHLLEEGRKFEIPRNKVEQRLVKIWIKVLGVHHVGTGDNFFDLGGHSLLAARMVAHIRKKMRKDIPADVLLRAPTVEQLAEVLSSYDRSASWSSLVPVQTSGSRPPLFWVYGGAKSFLQRYLGPDQPIYGLVQQSQDGRRALYTTVEEIASYYLKEIQTVQSAGPYFLGGYCFGAMVALEMAQQLRNKGHEVPLLFLVEPPARCLPAVKPLKALRRHFRDLSRLGPREKLEYLLKGVKGVSEEKVRKAKRRLRMALCESYFRMGRPLPHSIRKFYIGEIHGHASRAYVPRPYPGKVTMFRAENLSTERRSDWSRLADSVDIREVSGADHVGIIRQPHIGIWAEQLNVCLRKIRVDLPLKEK